MAGEVSLTHQHQGSDWPPRVRPELPAVQRQHRLGPDEVHQLVVAYRRGSAVAVLAGRFEVHPNTVLDHLKRAGVARRPCVRKLTDELLAQAAALHEAGWSYKRLGELYQVDGETVRKEVRRLNQGGPTTGLEEVEVVTKTTGTEVGMVVVTGRSTVVAGEAAVVLEPDWELPLVPGVAAMGGELAVVQIHATDERRAIADNIPKPMSSRLTRSLAIDAVDRSSSS